MISTSADETKAASVDDGRSLLTLVTIDLTQEPNLKSLHLIPFLEVNGPCTVIK